MQLNQILQPFTQATSKPQALQIATINDIRTHFEKRTNSVQLHKGGHYWAHRFTADIQSLINEELDYLEFVGADLYCIDSHNQGYGYSNHTIKSPQFFLSLNQNKPQSNFNQIEVLTASLLTKPVKSSYSYEESTEWVLEVKVRDRFYVMTAGLETIKKFPNFSFKHSGEVTIGNITVMLEPKMVLEYLRNTSYAFRRNAENIYRLTYATASCLYGTDLLTKDALSQVMLQISKLPGVVTIVGQLGSGISKTYSKNVAPYTDALLKDSPLHWSMLNSIAFEAGRTIDSVKLSTVFNAVFENVTDIEDLKERIWPKDWDLNKNTYGYYSNDVTTSHWYQAQAAYKDQRRKVLKSQGNRAITKIMEEVDSLNLDEKSYPKTYKAITSGEIPLGTFFRKSEQYFIFNDNWALWEEMLAKHPDVTKEIAASAAPRTTYEKDLMSYFYFVLYALPEYLKAQTKEKWTCIPRLVDSPNELEPPKEDANGTPGVTRKRSALTPIVDNDNKTVVVPYASLALHGRQTTYCYSLDYQVLRKGFSFKGNVVMSDVEEKLNGRDDYGLMFYTLTGSEQGRGYPTFLIIFERRKNGTHVHFHRTHPSRSKDGDYNPIHNWTRVCYNWMIGNVAKENIIAQQGDLAFVKTEDTGKRDFSDMVKAYDNHIFAAPIYFSPNTASSKNNVLGYVKLTEENTLQHHEHEWVTVPAGVYEVRQCRSWEANPKGVWSLRID